MTKSANIKQNIYVILLTPLLSVCMAMAVFYLEVKYIAALVFFTLIAGIWINTNPIFKIFLTITAITFPIILQFMGQDAISTGTLIIFATLAWAMAKRKLSSTISNDLVIFNLLFLIAAIGLAGMITKTPSAYWGPAVRHYVNLISSIAVFILIIHAQGISGIAKNKREYIERIITALLLITVLHIFISLLLFNFPWVAKYFAIFLHRTEETLGASYIQSGLYTRVTSIFTAGEEFGELLILVFPFALYKIFTSPKKIYLIILTILLLGIVISGTRSALFLIAGQALFFIFVLSPREYNPKKIAITISVAVMVLLMLPMFLKYAPFLLDRVYETFTLLGKDAEVTRIANRQGVWPAAYDVTKRTLCLFGHGPIQAAGLGFPAKNFHNLFLSLLFQFGVVGIMVFLCFFFVIAKRLFITATNLKPIDTNRYLLAGACLLSFFCFLINEIKFEFNRSDSYQQIVWIFFAIFYLTGNLWLQKKRKNEKTNYH